MNKLSFEYYKALNMLTNQPVNKQYPDSWECPDCLAQVPDCYQECNTCFGNGVVE